MNSFYVFAQGSVGKGAEIAPLSVAHIKLAERQVPVFVALSPEGFRVDVFAVVGLR